MRLGAEGGGLRFDGGAGGAAGGNGAEDGGGGGGAKDAEGFRAEGGGMGGFLPNGGGFGLTSGADDVVCGVGLRLFLSMETAGFAEGCGVDGGAEGGGLGAAVCGSLGGVAADFALPSGSESY